MNNFTITDLDNLLIQMKAGLLPEQLDIEEVEMLKEVYGVNWFNELGYNDDTYTRSKYDHYKPINLYNEVK